MVLPAAFPNLLANGAQGIAVGMATSIPPHNAAELCDAALHLIDNPNARSKTLLKYVPGPDFPTGGIDRRSARRDRRSLYDRARLVPRARALEARRTPGAAPIRSWSPKSPGWCRRSRLVERIAELINEKKLPLVADVRDESAEDIRLVIEPRVAHGRSGADDGEPVQAHRAGKPHSAQHERAGARASVPKVVGLAEALREWLDHRRDVLVRRSQLPARSRSSTGSKCSAAI